MNSMLIVLTACIFLFGWIWQRESSQSREEGGLRKPQPEKPPRLPKESKQETGSKP